MLRVQFTFSFTKLSPVKAISGSLSSTPAFRTVARSTSGLSELVVLVRYGRTGDSSFSIEEDPGKNELIVEFT